MRRVDVKAIRSGLGYSLNQFSRALGVDRRTVLRWENGDVSPSPLAIAQLKKFQAPDGTPDASRANPTTSASPKRQPYEPKESP